MILSHRLTRSKSCLAFNWIFWATDSWSVTLFIRMFSVFLNISNFEKEWSHHHGNYIYRRQISRCMSNFLLLSFLISQYRRVFFSNSYQVQRQRWTGKIEQTKPWLIFTGKHPYPCFVSKRFDSDKLCSFEITTLARARKTFLSIATRAWCWAALSKILVAKCWIRWNTFLNGAASCWITDQI